MNFEKFSVVRNVRQDRRDLKTVCIGMFRFNNRHIVCTVGAEKNEGDSENSQQQHN
jgi:hypothetical protein